MSNYERLPQDPVPLQAIHVEEKSNVPVQPNNQPPQQQRDIAREFDDYKKKMAFKDIKELFIIPILFPIFAVFLFRIDDYYYSNCPNAKNNYICIWVLASLVIYLGLLGIRYSKVLNSQNPNRVKASNVAYSICAYTLTAACIVFYFVQQLYFIPKIINEDLCDAELVSQNWLTYMILILGPTLMCPYIYNNLCKYVLENNYVPS